MPSRVLLRGVRRRWTPCVAAVLACLALGATPALAVKIATWNATAYPTTNLAGRQTYFRQVLAALDPDVIALQELMSSAGRDSFLLDVLNVVEPG
jgi:hypothetical protein